MKTGISIGMATLGVILLLSGKVNAHVVVGPDKVGIGKYQTFTMSVPTEKDQPTTRVRLVIPEGIDRVRPNVKAGWQIEIKQAGEGEAAKVTELQWFGGSIPADMREEFNFSARTATAETELQWKAYQTYQDGTVVAWDMAPTAESHGAPENPNSGPFSVTKVINDLQPAAPAAQKPDRWPYMLSSVALMVAAAALFRTVRARPDR